MKYQKVCNNLFSVTNKITLLPCNTLLIILVTINMFKVDQGAKYGFLREKCKIAKFDPFYLCFVLAGQSAQDSKQSLPQVK